MDPGQTDYRKVRVGETVLRHLEANPGAGDTLTGILISWLRERRIETTAEELAEVLADFVDAQLLKEVLLPDGNTLYVRGQAVP